MEETQKIVEELERRLRQICNPVEQNANKISREIAKTLVVFLQGGGELPEGLVLSIGAVLVQHVSSGEQMANDIQRLYSLIEKASGSISSEDTIKSSG